MPWLCPSWVKFLILNVVLRVSRRKKPIFFLCGAFLSCVVDEIFINAPWFRGKLPCPEKFLVTRLRQQMYKGSKIATNLQSWKFFEMKLQGKDTTAAFDFSEQEYYFRYNLLILIFNHIKKVSKIKPLQLCLSRGSRGLF